MYAMKTLIFAYLHVMNFNVKGMIKKKQEIEK